MATDLALLHPDAPLCPACDGEGWCPDCHGSGDDYDGVYVHCPRCDGLMECPDCGGSGLADDDSDVGEG